MTLHSHTDFQPATAGHNGRAADIKRTADELRMAFLVQHNKGAKLKQQILNYALVDPTVTGMEYKVLSLELKFSNEDGSSCFLKPENGAKLLGCSVDTYERASRGSLKASRISARNSPEDGERAPADITRHR